MDIKSFVFSVECFPFSKFSGQETKQGKPNIKRDLTVVFLLQKLAKIGLKFYEVTFFVGK